MFRTVNTINFLQLVMISIQHRRGFYIHYIERDLSLSYSIAVKNSRVIQGCLTRRMVTRHNMHSMLGSRDERWHYSYRKSATSRVRTIGTCSFMDNVVPSMNMEQPSYSAVELKMNEGRQCQTDMVHGETSRLNCHIRCCELFDDAVELLDAPSSDSICLTSNRR
jgi:hypothetical protein